MSTFLDSVGNSFNDFVNEVGSFFGIDSGSASSVSDEDDYVLDTTSVMLQNTLLFQANKSTEQMLAYIHGRNLSDDGEVAGDESVYTEADQEAALTAQQKEERDAEIQALIAEASAQIQGGDVEISELFLVLMQLLEKLGDVAADSKRAESEHYMNRKTQLNDELLQQMKEYREKVKEAEKKAKTMEVLTYVGAGLAIAVGAALMATGAGFFVGAIVIGLAVDAIYTQASGKDGAIASLTNELADFLEKETDLNEQEAQIVASVIIAVGLIIVTMGAGALGSAMAGGASTATATAAASANRAAQMAKLAVQVGTVFQAGLTISQAAMNIDLAITRYEAEMERVDVEEKKLQQELIQAMIEDVIERLEAIVKNKSEKISKQSEEIDRNGQVMALVANNIGD